MVTSPLMARAASTAGVDDLTVADGTCDFAAAGFGHGSASDPFLIGTSKALAEMIDCSSSSSARRQMNITGATGNGTLITYTTDGTQGDYGVGQVVTVSGITPSALNVTNARIVSVLSGNKFTVKSTATDSYTSGGNVVSEHDYYKLTADISLATGTEDWNDTRSAAITAVSGDGTTVTYTAANTFTTGDTVSIKGVAKSEYNLGTVTLASASSTQFTVTSSANAGASSGGTASRPGWANFDLYEADIDGQNFTISGLTIDNPDSYQGLFADIYRSNIENLAMTGVDIDTTGMLTSGDYVGALAGYTKGLGTANISVDGHIIGTSSYVGMFIGDSENGNHRSITTSGTIDFAALGLVSNSDSFVRPYRVGGVIGESETESTVDIHSSVDVNGFNTNTVGATTYKVYGQAIGGLLGVSHYSVLRDSSASGSVVGGYMVGGAIGEDDCCSMTSNSSASGDVSAYSNYSGWDAAYVGGFYGEEDCCSTRTGLVATGDVYVESTSDGGTIYSVGGLMGEYNCCGLVDFSHSTGNVTVVQNSNHSTYEIGGLLGHHDCCGDVSNSYTTGNVSITSTGGAVYEVGGFVGSFSCCGAIRYSYATGNVDVTVDAASHDSYEIGGFTGYFECCGTQLGTYATGDVTVNNGYDIGGHTGYADYSTSFVDSSAAGDVTVSYDGQASVGGLVGYYHDFAEMNRVSATGDVTVTPVTPGQSATAVGGLVGTTSGDESHVLIKDSFYKGTVSGSSYVGGLIGMTDDDYSYRAERVYVAARVNASDTDAVVDPVAAGQWVEPNKVNFFDKERAGTATNQVGFLGRTTANMKLAGTYTAKGWSFAGESPWRISSAKNNGYPYLVSVRSPFRKVVFTKIKTLYFSGTATLLTSAMKYKLRTGARALVVNGCSNVRLMAHPSLANYEVAGQRLKAAHEYLTTRLNMLGSSLKVVSNIRVRPKNSATNTVQLFCGS